MYIYTETQYIGHNKTHARLPTHKSLSEHVPVESIIACLCMSRPKDELDCELEVPTGNDFDYGKSMTCASCTCTPCTFTGPFNVVVTMIA